MAGSGGNGKKGGKRKGSGRKKGDPNNRGKAGKSPDQFMRELIVAGSRVDPQAEEAEAVEVNFDEQPKEYVDPVTFCQAVVNGDTNTLSKCGVMEIPTLDQKLDAAKIAVKYTNKAKPVETITKHEHSWIDGITQAEQRVKTLRMDPLNDDAPETVN